MVVGSAMAPTVTDYPNRFRGYIVKSVAHLLNRMGQLGTVLPPPDRAQALHTLSYALKLPEGWSQTRELILNLAPKMERAGYRDEWMPYLEQGIRQSCQVGDTEAEAELRFHLGQLYQLRSNYEEARHHLEQSIKGFKQLNASYHQARALNQLAYVARLQRQFEQATGLVETAQQLLGEENAEWAFSYYVLGLVALDNRHWQQAIDFSEQAFKLWQQTGQQRLMGRSLLCRGVALEKMGRYPEAMAICQQAVILFEQIEDRFYQAIAQMNLGNVYFAFNQPFNALELYVCAEKNFRQVQDLLYLAHVNHNLGMSYHGLQQLDQAKEALLLSVGLWQQLNNVERWANSMDELGLVYLREGKVEKATAAFNEALTQLTLIKDEPGYAHWLEILTAHLREASEKEAKGG
jgi:tetratricopeptide (TPR) repeat protein